MRLPVVLRPGTKARSGWATSAIPLFASSWPVCGGGGGHYGYGELACAERGMTDTEAQRVTGTGHTRPSWLPLLLPFLHMWESAAAEGLRNSALSVARGLEWALDQGQQLLHICDSGCRAFGRGSKGFPEKPGPELGPRPSEG